MTTLLRAIQSADQEPSPWPASDILILRGRVIRPGTPKDRLSRFSDDTWHLQPAHPDVHQGVWAVHWSKFPAELVLPLKTVCLTLLDHPVPAEHAVRTATKLLAIQTISHMTHFLRVLAEWMSGRGLSRLCDLTDAHLDSYRDHVLALDCRPLRKRSLLNTVVLLHVYRSLLPPQCQMATSAPWGGKSGDNLVTVPPPSRVNKTPRIAPETMEALLAWSLTMLETLGPDIAAAWQTYQQLRECSHPSQAGFAGLPARDRLARFLAGARRDGTALPGKLRPDGGHEVNEYYLSRLLGLDESYTVLKSDLQRRMVEQAGLPIADDSYIDTTIAGVIDGRPWRQQPITLGELHNLVRYLIAACYVIVCYLSGLRPGEALNLRRGCREVDQDTGELLVVGRRGKGRGRAPTTGADDELQRPWVVVQPVHDAIAMLERLTRHPFLFPPDIKHPKPHRSADDHARSSHYMACDINDFIDWVNRSFTPADGTVPIPSDPTKPIHLARFRRTLAYFIVRRPRGLIAAALQYGHVATKVTLSYAGDSDTGWMDAVAIERLEFVLEQVDHDRALLDEGEHVSGPSADEYATRITRMSGFAGRVVTSVRNAERLLARTDPSIHHGEGMTCVWTKETAACRTAKLAIGLSDQDAPDESECRSTCPNLAYTDRDIEQLQQRLVALDARTNDSLAPRPLRDRAAAQAANVQAIIDRHERGRPVEATTGAGDLA